MKTLITRYPFGPVLLFILIPYLKWYKFAGYYQIWEAHWTAFKFALAIFIVMALLAWLTKSWQAAGRIGLLLAALMLFTFDQYIIAMTIAGFIVLTAFVDQENKTTIAVIFGNVLGLISLFQLYPVWLDVTNHRKTIETTSEQLGDIILNQKPTIIHIVLDGYGASDTLKDYYYYDNSRFLASLASHGFLVMPKVSTPYNQTLFVMASVFSGGYIKTPDAADNARSYRSDLGYTIINGSVVSIFRNAGYNFGYTKSGYSYLDMPNAKLLTPTSYITGLEAHMFAAFPNLYSGFRNREIRSALDPENFSKLQPPYYYYQHILAPHPPFTLIADGQAARKIRPGLQDGSHYIFGSTQLRKQYIEGYREQIMGVENSILDQLANIPKDIPIIVIIHGDHGPGAYFNHENAEKTCQKDRMTTLFAIYSNVPEIQKAFARNKDPSFNLVNIYRILFSSISDVSMAPLASESRFLRWSSPSTITKISADMLSKDCN